MHFARVISVTLLLVIMAPGVSVAQRETTSELLEMYVRNRAITLATDEIRRTGGRLEPIPPVHLPSASDSLWMWLMSLKPPEIVPDLYPDQIIIESVQLVEHLRRPVFDALFDTTRWAFVGSNARAGLDTLRTRDLRARMEAVFGPPTRTLVELDSVETLEREEVIEFEYWFIVNDSIPVMVLDVNGPWDRGVVVAASENTRNRLRDLKDALLGQLLDEPRRKPFVDYYFNVPQRAWYVTGYDGAMFFDQRIGRPDLTLGRPTILPYLRND